MALSHELISQFAKLVVQDKKTNTETTVYGTIVVDGDGKYVQIDGSDQLTPIEDGTAAADANAGERVSVLIKNHTATVTGNVSSPAARTGDVKDLGDRVTEVEKFDLVLADRVEANEGYIKELQADVAEFGDLKAATAKIGELEAKDVEITGRLDASEATIENLKTTKLDAEVADVKFATIASLNATVADIAQLEANKASVEDLEAAEADIAKLSAEKASIKDLEATEAKIADLDATFATIENLEATDAKVENLEAEDAKINDTLDAHNAVITNLNASYATIDFANIKMAAVEELFTKSGIIKDLVVNNTSITGELVGVTLKGDLIEAGTLKADKLVVKGSDGIFYKLNVEAGGISASEAPTDGLHGSVIVAKSITAEKVNVKDLVAFGATIGGFHITDTSLYSGVKASVDNTTEGVYLDSTGNFAIGNAEAFIRYTSSGESKNLFRFTDAHSLWGEFSVPSVPRGKNLLDYSECTFYDCTYDEDTGIITSNINDQYFCTLSTTSLNTYFFNHQGETFTFSTKTVPDDTFISVVIRVARESSSYFESGFAAGKTSLTFTIPTDFTGYVTGVDFRFNRKGTPFTDTTTEFSEFQLELGSEATPYEPFKHPSEDDFIVTGRSEFKWCNDLGDLTYDTNIEIRDNLDYLTPGTYTLSAIDTAGVWTADYGEIDLAGGMEVITEIPYTFTLTEEDIASGVPLYISFGAYGVYLDSHGTIQIQIEEGATATEYEKYTPPKQSKLEISADTLILGSSKKNVEETIDEVSESVRANSEDLTNYIEATTKELENLQGQIDGSITTWFYEYVPTNDNIPASEWTTTDLKNNHLGDLFYDTITGYCYRWQVQNNEYFWTPVKDTDVVKALEDAAKAQSTADNKRRVFVTTPTTPYDVGDLWTQGPSGDLMRCQTAKTASQSYAAADWVKASKYTDDTAANAAQADANALKTRVTSAETRITQNEKDIALRATKTEVAETLSGFYTKTESDANLKVSADSVKTEVSKTYATKQEVSDIEIGGRNLLLNSSFKDNIEEWTVNGEVFDVEQTVSGLSIVRADNVSKNSSRATAKLSSKNLLPYPYLQNSKTENGITITVNGDGSITIKGTCTVNFKFVLCEIILPPATYTLSGISGGGASTFYLSISDATALFDGYRAFTLAQQLQTRANIYFVAGATIDTTLYPQLELGSTATPYTPYKAAEDLIGSTISVGGKNLFQITEERGCFGEVGVYAQVGTSEIEWSCAEDIQWDTNIELNDSLSYLPAGIYTLSFTESSGNWYTDHLTLTLGGIEEYYHEFPLTFTITEENAYSEDNRMIFSLSRYGINEGESGTVTIQIEEGETATDYEPYKEPATYTADEDGIVTIEDVYAPTTTILTDLPGVWIDATYCVETGFVEKLGKQCLNIKHVDFGERKYVQQDIFSRIDIDSRYVFSGWFMTENIVQGPTNPYIAIYMDGRAINSDGTETTYSLAKVIPYDTQGEWQHITYDLEMDNIPENASSLRFRIFTRDITGDLYFRHLKLEKGTKATDWTSAPEDVENALANSSNELMQEISKVSASIETTSEAVTLKALESYAKTSDVEKTVEEATAELKVSAGAITARVEEVEGVLENGEFSQVKIKGKDFKMDADGFTVEGIKPDGSHTLKTTVSDNGMTVYDNNSPVLTANDEGVKAKDLHANTYLIIGEGNGSSRFEDYANHTRTACFWIGN